MADQKLQIKTCMKERRPAPEIQEEASLTQFQKLIQKNWCSFLYSCKLRDYTDWQDKITKIGEMNELLEGNEGSIQKTAPLAFPAEKDSVTSHTQKML